MSDVNFQLNPCQSCLKHYDIKDLNDINQCCSDTAAAFAGVAGINNIRNLPSFQNCTECVAKSINALGTDTCDIRLTAYPTWVQVPNLYPNLLQETKNKAEALSRCEQECLKSRYPQECIERCHIQNDAVVELYNEKKENPNNSVQYDQKETTPSPKITKPPKTTSQKIQYWIAFIIIFAILFFFIL